MKVTSNTFPKANSRLKQLSTKGLRGASCYCLEEVTPLHVVIKRPPEVVNTSRKHSKRCCGKRPALRGVLVDIYTLIGCACDGLTSWRICTIVVHSEDAPWRIWPLLSVVGQVADYCANMLQPRARYVLNRREC